MEKTIDIRSEFSSFVRGYGGVVSDDDPRKPNQQKNADYVFHKQRVIAELKCLEENKIDDIHVSQQIENCFEKWGIPRTAEIGEIQRVEMTRLPVQCANELSDIKKKPLRTVVESASSQIKATRSALNAPDYQGLLLVANDGDFSLPQLTLWHLLSEILNGSGSGVNSVVLFTANLACPVPRYDHPSLIWNYGHPRRARIIDDQFILDLGQKWQAHLETLTGISFKAIYGDEGR